MNTRETLNTLMAECLEDARTCAMDAGLGSDPQAVAIVAATLFKARPLAEHIMARMEATQRPLSARLAQQRRSLIREENPAPMTGEKLQKRLGL
jgi:hypothetical protein